MIINLINSRLVEYFAGPGSQFNLTAAYQQLKLKTLVSMSKGPIREPVNLEKWSNSSMSFRLFCARRCGCFRKQPENDLNEPD